MSIEAKKADEAKALKTIEFMLNDKLGHQEKWLWALNEVLREYKGKVKPKPFHIGGGMYSEDEPIDPDSAFAIEVVENKTEEIRKQELKISRTKNALAYVREKKAELKGVE